MNKEESKLFAMELTIAFPEFKAIGEKSSPNWEATKQSWGIAWTDLSIEECREALKRLMVDGEISYEHYRAPGPFIRKLVLESRKRTQTSERDEVDQRHQPKRRSDYKGSPMASALCAALKAKRDCLSESKALALIDAAFPAQAHYDQPRYHCHHCMDRGLIDVWRVDSVAAYKDGRISRDKMGRGHTYRVACMCGTGAERNQPKNQRKKLPTYSSGHFCKYANLSHDEDLELLDQWINEQSKGVAWVA